MSVTGAYLMYPSINLAGIDRVNVEISGQTGSVGGNWTLRAGSPTGPIVARLEDLPDTGTTYWGVGGDAKFVWLTDDIVDPGGVNDLYVVVDYPPGTTPGRIALRNMQFITAPESVTATVNPTAPDGANGWYKANPTITVSTGGMPLWTRQTSVDGGATWTNTNAEGAATISDEGVNTVMYRAIDSAGVVADGGSLTIRLDRTAPQAPTVDGVVDGATYGDSEILRLGLESSDATSGIDRVSAALDGAGSYASGATIPLHTLPLGEHTLVATATDRAGHESTTTVRFTTRTSFADMHALIARIAGVSQRKRLKAELNQVTTALAEGRTADAIRQLRNFRTLASDSRWVPSAELRAALVRDSDAMLEEIGG